MGKTSRSSIVTRALSSISLGIVRAPFESGDTVNARTRRRLFARQRRGAAPHGMGAGRADAAFYLSELAVWVDDFAWPVSR